MTQETGLITFDPFKAMDMLDDAAILAELEGRVVGEWVYHFPQEGKEIWGLSKVGVDQACREMALQGEVVREDNVQYELDPTDNRYVLFKAFAGRVAVNKDGGEVYLDRVVGTKRQCVFVITQKEGITTRPNAFWFEQGSIKALRNARLRLISEEVRSKILALAKAKGKVAKINPKGEAQVPTSTLASAVCKGTKEESSGDGQDKPITSPESDLDIDMEWVTETMERTRFRLPTLVSWLRSKANYTGLDTTGKIEDIISRMTKPQKEFLAKELQDRLDMV